MNCDTVLSGDFAERYVLDQLSEAERDDYEVHYFACEPCFEQLRNYQALQSVLREKPRPEPRLQGGYHQRSPWRYAAAAAVIVIASSAVWWATREPAASVPVSSREQVQPQPRRSASPDPASLRELAHIVPPTYQETALRGAGSSVQPFQKAMRAYTRADYAAAIPQLQAAERLDPRSPAPEFYLGICDLMTNDTADGLSELRKVAATRDSLYREPADFYLAKAFLAKGDTEAAAIELQSAIALHGDKENEARALLKQIQELAARH